MKVVIRVSSPRIHGLKDKIAITRGPLVFCLENIDNTHLDIFTLRVNTSSMVNNPDCVTILPALLGSTDIIARESRDCKKLIFVPYFL